MQLARSLWLDGDKHWKRKLAEILIALHLEEKLKKTPGVVTVEDFITKVASHCEHTGKTYLIRQPDGKEVEASQWFREQLKDIPTDDSEIID